MKQIKFNAPANLHGRFATVRLGRGWTLKAKQGDEVEMVDLNSNSHGIAVVRDFWNGDLALVPASLTEIMHDPLARTFSGLIWIMRILYPGEQILPQTNVTVVVLEKVRDRAVVTNGALLR
jgi:hypothetical protein